MIRFFRTLFSSRWKLLYQWIDFLRENPDRQCRRELQDSKGNFCVIGALCNIYDDSQWSCVDGQMHYAGTRASYAPEEVAGAVGLSGSTLKCLSMLNDIGFSYDFLADIIEHDFC